MKCPHCKAASSRVVESRPAADSAAVRRRRECSQCGHRFTTYERHERQPLFVRKRSGERQPFDRPKLRSGLLRASHKRPIAESEIGSIVDSIQSQVERAGGELPAQRIGEICLERLMRLDRVSYLQFAAVYKQLADVEEVQAELTRLESEPALKDAPFDPDREAGYVRDESDDSVLPPQAA